MEEAVEPDETTVVRRMRTSPPPVPNRNHVDEDDRPSDSGGTTFWACVVLGISCLLPWNLFITAHAYFSYKFRGSNESNSSTPSDENDLAHSFEVYFTLTASAAGVLAAILNVALTSRISASRRMVAGHGMVIFSLILSIIFCFIDTDRWQMGFLILNLIFIIFGQFGCTFIAGSTFSIAAQLPEARFTNAVVSAQAFCGIFTSVVSIVSIAVGSGSRPSIIGAVYFSIALVFMLVSLGNYFSLRKNVFAQYYLRKTAFSSLNEDVEPLIDDQAVVASDDDILDVRVENKARTPTTRRGLRALIRKTLYHGVVLMMTLMASLICFPSLTSMVKSTASPSSDWQTYFIPVGCFLMFNMMDFIGRLFGSCVLWPKPGSLLIWFFALLRFGFLFVFLFCNLPPRDEDAANRKLPIVFNDDSYFILFIALLGLTNGYLANLASIYLPYSVDEQDRERAGASNTFYCAIGVLLGALISLIVVKYATV